MLRLRDIHKKNNPLKIQTKYVCNRITRTKIGIPGFDHRLFEWKKNSNVDLLLK